MDNIRINHNLIIALVEPWSLETNTFHLPVGEIVITLPNIVVILGIRINDDPLIGRYMWERDIDEIVGLTAAMIF
ncbi:Serine/threonine-protein phosphatase 7 long form like [Apostasia shenzhenica]|uniref:Serine/threonine-protein phosphatase 7 long form like n=1 Tax=Apostasia shenzhenica TaxID=1088818 RepID=A0A2I0BGY9_9ASPA|nr:Serine/threonine-protein phosphatase 7 long form like [Apostasia shenzhenica]